MGREVSAVEAERVWWRQFSASSGWSQLDRDGSHPSDGVVLSAYARRGSLLFDVPWAYFLCFMMLP